MLRPAAMQLRTEQTKEGAYLAGCCCRAGCWYMGLALICAPPGPLSGAGCWRPLLPLQGHTKQRVEPVGVSRECSGQTCSPMSGKHQAMRDDSSAAHHLAQLQHRAHNRAGRCRQCARWSRPARALNHPACCRVLLKAYLRARDISSSCSRKASARSGSIRGWLRCRKGAAKSSSGGMGFRRPSLPCSRLQQREVAAGGRKAPQARC